MTEEMSFPLERSPAMRILGGILTGKLSGQIIVAVLLIIGVAFMGGLQFAPISIIFFFVFFVPVSIMVHLRIISKGKKLMGGWCDIRYYTESKTLEYRTGFPNTMQPEWQEAEITEEIENIHIIGGEVGGYQLRLGEPEDKAEAIRLGLWVKLDDVKEAAEKLANLWNGEIFIDITEQKENEQDEIMDKSE